MQMLKAKTVPKTTEKGFTLVEVLVSLTIAGAILGVMSAAVLTIMKTSAQNEEWNMNLRQVQNAGHWITRDALMAQVVSDNTTGYFLTLSWYDWDNNNNTANYVLNGNTLTRSYNGGAATLIAQYVVSDPAFTSCQWNDIEKKLTVKIRASLNNNNRYVEKIYEISPRPATRGG